MKIFSTTWKSSKLHRKQRKYLKKAPLHIRAKFLNASLSEELSRRYSKRAVRVRKGDRVKITKGQFKGKSGKVERVDTKNSRLYVEGVEIQKKDGTKVKQSVHVSNVMITELTLEDKGRQKKLKEKKDGKKAP